MSVAFFSVKPKSSVIHQVLVAQEHNARHVLAHTKGRAEVRGGGKKPWRQKGTGRARHGSIRSPLWVGGGVTFGPTKERSFSQKVNKKMRQKAVFMCLTDKLQNERMFLLETLTLEKPKTKDMAMLFSKLPNSGKKILVAFHGKNPELVRAVSNLGYVKAVGVNSLNVGDLLNYEYFATTEDGIAHIKELYAKIDFSKRSEKATA